MPVDPSLLRQALAPTRRPVTADQALRAFDGDRSALAQAIAGTSDKKSKAYKAAMRNLQRYAAGEGRQHRTPKQLAPRLTEAVQWRRTVERLTGPLHLRWAGPVIKISSDERQRLDFDAELSDDDLAEVRELLEGGDEQGAVDLLAALSLADYLGDTRADGVMTSAAGLRIIRS